MKKRIISLLLSVILIFSFCSLTQDGKTYAASANINKTKMTIYVGNKGYVKVTGTTSSITWSSSDKSIATVNKWGTVTGVKKGTVTITAKVGTKSYKCAVTVKNPYISPYNTELKTNETIKLKLIGAKNGSKINWISNDESIATISQWGTVTAISEGNTTITATIGKKSYKTKVTVIGNKLVDVSSIISEPTTFCFKIDSLGLVQANFGADVLSEKDIKYITFEFSLKNRVGDLIKSDISDTYYVDVECTGAYKSGDKIEICQDIEYFTNANELCLTQVEIEYVDGTKEIGKYEYSTTQSVSEAIENNQYFNY